MRSRLHPDGRLFVHDPDRKSLGEATTDVYCVVNAAQLDSYLALGFEVLRREGTYLVPTRGPRVGVPPGVDLKQADKVAEAGLRLLDDELRQDVPGAVGWQWGEADFRAETYEAADFDPATYLVALDSDTEEPIGIARVWKREPIPRLGFVGVRRAYRRRGIARGLLAEVFARLEERGISEVSTEIDDTNTASLALFEGLGAHRTGTAVELVRRYVHPASRSRS
jgi:ribosomal protein S18 acetylase RimI-like enzyme